MESLIDAAATLCWTFIVTLWFINIKIVSGAFDVKQSVRTSGKSDDNYWTKQAAEVNAKAAADNARAATAQQKASEANLKAEEIRLERVRLESGQ